MKDITISVGDICRGLNVGDIAGFLDEMNRSFCDEDITLEIIEWAESKKKQLSDARMILAETGEKATIGGKKVKIWRESDMVVACNYKPEIGDYITCSRGIHIVKLVSPMLLRGMFRLELRCLTGIEWKTI